MKPESGIRGGGGDTLRAYLSGMCITSNPRAGRFPTNGYTGCTLGTGTPLVGAEALLKSSRIAFAFPSFPPPRRLNATTGLERARVRAGCPLTPPPPDARGARTVAMVAWCCSRGVCSALAYSDPLLLACVDSLTRRRVRGALCCLLVSIRARVCALCWHPRAPPAAARPVGRFVCLHLADRNLVPHVAPCISSQPFQIRNN